MILPYLFIIVCKGPTKKSDLQHCFNGITSSFLFSFFVAFLFVSKLLAILKWQQRHTWVLYSLQMTDQCIFFPERPTQPEHYLNWQENLKGTGDRYTKWW